MSSVPSHHDEPSLAEEIERMQRDGTLAGLLREAVSVCQFHGEVPMIQHRNLAWATVRRLTADRMIVVKLSIEVQRRPDARRNGEGRNAR